MFIALLWNDINYTQCPKQAPKVTDYEIDPIWQDKDYWKNSEFCLGLDHLVSRSFTLSHKNLMNWQVKKYFCLYTNCEIDRINTVLYPARAILFLLMR